MTFLRRWNLNTDLKEARKWALGYVGKNSAGKDKDQWKGLGVSETMPGIFLEERGWQEGWAKERTQETKLEG